MRTSAVSGIIFANSNDNLLKKLTAIRSMASVPFGSRYRLIDFSLSNLVNAGVYNVGIITKENYHSLMDHVGSGLFWDLDRKNGGLHLLPPYISSGLKRYSGTIDALYGAKDFIKRCKSDYIVLCAGDILANVDISDVIDCHIKKGADVTTVYHKGILPPNRDDAMIFDLEDDGRIASIKFNCDIGTEAYYGIGITVISRDLLSNLVYEAYHDDLPSFNRNVLAVKLKELKIYGYEHSEFVSLMNGTDTYYKANMALLNSEVRKQLFNKERPIYTKTRDDMPTRYGTKSSVSNSIIGSGCVIEGTVINSIIFRGVKVEKGAVIKDCILMQETCVGANSELSNVIADKNSIIGKNKSLSGTEQKQIFISKNQIV
ncbi:MAG: glucose-1-phosphate adenylyltransferase subunit GlgD [Clostridia bacterium]|nr:glucose-1-phosphate adenylyltransferase subunit GlgD [Clostridia bacterium]